MNTLALLLLSLAAAPQAIQQRTSGPCSPAIANTNGNVTINCDGIDPRALKRLNELLDQKDKQLDEKIREAEQWREKYLELERRLSDTTGDPQLSAEAKEYLHEGELDKAQETLKALLGDDEKEVDRIASDHFNMGLVFDLEFQASDALRQFQAAHYYRPDEPEFAHQYARSLEAMNRLTDAVSVYNHNLPRVRALAHERPQLYLPLLAQMLHNLGTDYMFLGQLPDAEKSYQESASLYSQLDSTHPSEYVLMRASALEGLASALDKDGASRRADEAYHESLDLLSKTSSVPALTNSAEAELVLDNLAEDAAAKGDTERAEAMLDQVMATARKMQSSRQLGYAWISALTFLHLSTPRRPLQPHRPPR
jgi:tetratricopeptide (TPR) repeat protein